jgi:threonylcarbamoyladenosine tRNA methylthiotransferase MtaB
MDKKMQKIVLKPTKLILTICGNHWLLRPTKPQETLKLKELDAVLGRTEKFQLIDLLDGFRKEPS